MNNNKTKVPTGPKLNDKDYITNILMFFKAFDKNMTTALTEASNEILFTKYYKMYDKGIKLQRNLYELMFKNGWYVLEEVPSKNVIKLSNTLTQELNDLED